MLFILLCQNLHHYCLFSNTTFTHFIVIGNSVRPCKRKYHWDQRPWRCHFKVALQWRHNEHNGVSNHQPHDWLLKRLFKRRSKKTSKLRVTGLCAGKSPVTGESSSQRASNAENVSIWWRNHGRRDIKPSYFSRTICTYINAPRSPWHYVLRIWNQWSFRWHRWL